MTGVGVIPLPQPRGSFDPTIHRFKALSAADPANANTNTGTTMASGTLYGVRFKIGETGVLSALGMQVATQAVSPTSFFAAVYDADGALLCSSASTTASVTGTGYKETSFSAASRGMAVGELVHGCILFVGTTGPVLIGNNTSGMYAFGLTAAPYRFATYGTGLSAVPASITPASGSASGFLPLIGLR